MSTSPLNITNFGAFTLGTAQLIASAIQQAGFSTTGNIYYCDPANGNDQNNGLLAQQGNTVGQGPVQTLAAGYALLVSGHNDILVLIGNGTSTGTARVSATFTWSKNAAHLIGICAPSAISMRARIAPKTTDTAFASFFVVSGNGCLFQNVSWFQGFTAGVAASICMLVSGTRNAFINCDIEGMGDTTSATSATSRNLVLSADENYFKHCSVGLDTVSRTGANASVEFKSACARNIFEDCNFPFWSGDGTTLGIVGTGADCMDRFQLFRYCVFVNSIKSGGGTAMTVLASLTNAAPGGLLGYHNCLLIGVTKFGDTNALANSYCYGAANSTANSLAANPA
jgi:hypothetical protein